MSKVRPSVQNLLPLFPPHLEISPLSHVLNSEYIIRDYLQTRLVILPHRLDSARHIQAGEFSPWRTIHERTSTTDRGRGGGTQENPFPTNVQFSCWRLVERIERGYPFPANRPGPQLVLPRSVFLSSLNEPSVVDRSTRNLCENLRCRAIDSIRKNDRLIISVTKLLWLFIGGFGSVLYEVITFVE